jgi:hypothetical protein
MRRNRTKAGGRGWERRSAGAGWERRRQQREGMGAADAAEKWKIWGGGKKLTWRGGTHELGRRIGKLLEQIVF